jgi:hypothetical protein
VIDVGRTADEPICPMDYLSTLRELPAYDMPDARPIDGVSMLRLLPGEAWAPDRCIPFAAELRRQQSPSASIISQGHKLLLGFDRNRRDGPHYL